MQLAPLRRERSFSSMTGGTSDGGSGCENTSRPESHTNRPDAHTNGPDFWDGSGQAGGCTSSMQLMTHSLTPPGFNP
jgi:hypothetical protein